MTRTSAPIAGTSRAQRVTTIGDRLITVGDPSWDDARRAWQLSVDQRPAAVAMPGCVDDRRIGSSEPPELPGMMS